MVLKNEKMCKITNVCLSDLPDYLKGFLLSLKIFHLFEANSMCNFPQFALISFQILEHCAGVHQPKVGRILFHF